MGLCQDLKCYWQEVKEDAAKHAYRKAHGVDPSDPSQVNMNLSLTTLVTRVADRPVAPRPIEQMRYQVLVYYAWLAQKI